MSLGKNSICSKIYQRLLKQSCLQSTRLLCWNQTKLLPLQYQAKGTSNEICAVNYRPIKISTVSYSSVLSDPENKGSHQKGVNFDTLGSWNNRLDMPILVEKSIEKGKLIPKIPLDEVGIASLIGRRKINEDRWIVKQLTPDILYFGIFDGHGGTDVVDYACRHMEDHLYFGLSQTNDLSKVLASSFVNLNNVIARHLAYYNMDQDLNMMGTTATICLLRNSIELVVGHVGDSRAVLSREGQAIRLSPTAHCTDPDLPSHNAPADLHPFSLLGVIIRTNNIELDLLAHYARADQGLLFAVGLYSSASIYSRSPRHHLLSLMWLYPDGQVVIDFWLQKVQSRYKSPLQNLCLQFTTHDSHDHEAQDLKEAKRIKEYGGTVTENSLGTLLVNGRLNMTRSLGDVELKKFGVTAHPYIRSIEVKHGKDAFLVLMTDGLSYVLSDQEICDIIISSAIPSEAASLVTDQALQFGSEDNVTAVIIPFGAWGKYRNTARTIPYSFGRNFYSTRY